MAIDDLLHHGIEILDTQRDSREAEPAQRNQLLASRMAGMNFDRGFETFTVHERFRQHRLQDPFKILGREKCRRASAEMKPEQRPPSQFRNAFKIKIPFLCQQIDISFFAAVVSSDHGVAGAERAERLTKWQMK